MKLGSDHTQNDHFWNHHHRVHQNPRRFFLLSITNRFPPNFLNENLVAETIHSLQQNSNHFSRNLSPYFPPNKFEFLFYQFSKKPAAHSPIATAATCQTCAKKKKMAASMPLFPSQPTASWAWSKENFQISLAKANDAPPYFMLTAWKKLWHLVLNSAKPCSFEQATSAAFFPLAAQNPHQKITSILPSILPKTHSHSLQQKFSPKSSQPRALSLPFSSCFSLGYFSLAPRTLPWLQVAGTKLEIWKGARPSSYHPFLE